MNKSSVVLPGTQGDWGSYISKYQPDSNKVLDNMFTAGSKNFVTDQTGMIDKRQGGVQWNRTSFGQSAQDTYEAIFESGARHFLRVGGGILSASTGTGLFDVITSGFSTLGNFEFVTSQNRTYGDNGINGPIVYDIATSYGGVSYSFTTGKTKPMGAQPPGSPLTAGTPTAGGSVPVGAHKYQVTFEYYGSEESNGSPSSASQTTTSGTQTIPLTNIPIGSYGVTARNIYRDNNGDNNFLLITTINDNTTTTFSDTIAQGSTPTPIPQFNNVPPTFSKCALWLDSVFIAPTGETNTVLFSNAGSPDIFDPGNFVTCQSDDIVTALYVYNGKLWVFGLHSVGTIEGTTPDTFFYHNLNNKIGCVDNRSIQVRSLVSIPTLWWLSDKGFYYSNGYTVEYGSDFIQDLVNLNIAQVNYALGKNTQTSFTDFSGDTITPSIDITSQPGNVTTINPEAVYDTAAEWSTGLLSNIALLGDQLAVPIGTGFDLPSGVVSGSTIIVSNQLTLPMASPQGGEAHAVIGTSSGDANTVSDNIITSVAQKIVRTFDGTITSVEIDMFVDNNTGAGWTIALYSDAGGSPGSPLFSTTVPVPLGINLFAQFVATGLSWTITGGTNYWLQVNVPGNNSANGRFTKVYYSGIAPGWSGNVFAKARNGANPWNSLSDSASNNFYTLTGSYGFTQTGGSPESGTWTSGAYDTHSTTVSAGMSFQDSASYPASTAVSVQVQGSNDALAWTTTDTLSNPAGTTSLVGGTYRYWRLFIALSTTNSLRVPAIGSMGLFFNTTGTWISAPIDGTTDNTGWSTLTFTGNVPLGTTVSLAIATSTDNIVYSSFGPIGSAATTRWAKIRLILTTDGTNSVSPSVSSAMLTWAVTGTITSSIIDTGTIPAGFGIFQWSEVNVGVGSVTFYIRTASSAGGIPGATFVAVTNGSFPALSALEFVQWKGVLSSTANATPIIEDVTVNWYIGSGAQGVRVSSIFYNKTYYVSVATLGSTTNNTIIQLDQFGKWRIQKDASVGTFLLYFNSLYFTDGMNGNIYNGFIAPTDNGTPIVMDVRTKAWPAVSDLFLKVPRGLKVTGLNTGTTIHAYYSFDRGNTWVEMLNEQGITGYTTTTDLSEFVTLFVPDALSLSSGRTLMYRIVSSDRFPCSIMNYTPSFYTRRGRYLSG